MTQEQMAAECLDAGYREITINSYNDFIKRLAAPYPANTKRSIILDGEDF